MFALVRGVTYATVFIGLVLVFVPARILSVSGIVAPSMIGVLQVAGMIVTAAGAALAVWCVLAFAIAGKGTPAPFDPPRQLVIRGPYRRVRNPMYIGAGLALAGVTFYFESVQVFFYTTAFFAIAHVFVVLYEEPTLKRMFGDEYDEYRKSVRRWWPK